MKKKTQPIKIQLDFMSIANLITGGKHVHCGDQVIEITLDEEVDDNSIDDSLEQIKHCWEF